MAKKQKTIANKQKRNKDVKEKIKEKTKKQKAKKV